MFTMTDQSYSQPPGPAGVSTSIFGVSLFVHQLTHTDLSKERQKWNSDFKIARVASALSRLNFRVRRTSSPSTKVTADGLEVRRTNTIQPQL